jgi:hypothetical protein
MYSVGESVTRSLYYIEFNTEIYAFSNKVYNTSTKSKIGFSKNMYIFNMEYNPKIYVSSKNMYIVEYMYNPTIYESSNNMYNIEYIPKPMHLQRTFT